MKAKSLLICTCLAVTITATCANVLAQQPSQVNVREFGAKGDGTTDDTAAFQRALESVAEKGGTVFVPIGNYLIKSHLNVPANVTLEGVWKIPTAGTAYKGSTLLAIEGEGSEQGTPFITLNANSVLKGITVFYPNQKPDNIKPYPWCIASSGGDNASIVDCLLVNPYQGVDFGTRHSGRHYIRNLYGQPLRRGIYVDKCFDIGRIENVHFWPFWTWDEKSGIREWLTKHGEAFIFARTDWEYVFNTFCFGYGIGYRFIKSQDGAMNGNLLGIGADACDIAVLVEATQAFGLLITNGEFVSLFGDRLTEVVTTPSFDGLVSFQNCSFWGPANQIARLDGSGTVSFNNCHFIQWDTKRQGLPAIEVHGGNLLVNGCNFREHGKQIALLGKTESAVITANRIAGALDISNQANANAQIGLNVYQKPPEKPKEEANAIVLDDTDTQSVKYIGEWFIASSKGDYYLGTRWARKGNGEAKAVFTPTIPKTGMYTVYAWFGPDPVHDHASDAPIEVKSAQGMKTVSVNLRPLTGQWIKLGTFRFTAGKGGSITFSNKADGNVLADAVKLVPAEK
ncbi:MAG: glycosyl hydrolase family 28-related protein [Armatimonadota bacterium]